MEMIENVEKFSNGSALLFFPSINPFFYVMTESGVQSDELPLFSVLPLSNIVSHMQGAHIFHKQFTANPIFTQCKNE